MPNIVSTCCNVTVQDGLKISFPYDNRYAVHQKIRFCDSCGKECDEVEACEECGVVGCTGGCEDASISILSGDSEGSALAG